MIEYSTSRFSDVISEIEEFYQDHYQEVEWYSKDFALRLDYNYYMYLDKEGKLLTVTAREDGNLIGYLIVTIGTLPHCLGVFAAKSDAFYVHPSMRSKGVGKGMLSYAEAKLEKIGVDVFAMVYKAEHNFSSMLKQLGFEDVEVVSAKVLGV